MKSKIEIPAPRNLPEELEIEILSYLPVKSLIRFTRVCKSWLRLIKTNHKFAMKHYVTRSTSSSNLLDNFDAMLNTHSTGTTNLYSFTKVKTFRPLHFFESNYSLRVSNSCHGIIFFCISVCGSSHIFLCNPSIRELILLPEPPIEPNHRIRLALGFDPINDNYKIVAICVPFSSGNPWIVSVYSVLYRQWRDVHAISLPPSIYDLGIYSVATNVNGRICNWLADEVHKGGARSSALVSFDMVGEVLKKVPMPECVDGKQRRIKLLSSSRWLACLSSCSWSRFPGFVDLWVLRGSISDSDPYENCMWSNDLVVKFPDHEPSLKPFYFWLNDKELLVYKGMREEVFHYSIDTKQLTRTGRYGAARSAFCDGYVESLVSIKNLMSMHHDDHHKVGQDVKHDIVVTWKKKKVIIEATQASV